MKIDEDQAPRRDGFIEAMGTAGEIVVGSVLAGKNRTDVWDVIDSRQPDQHEYAHTHFFRIRERKTGAEATLKPRLVNFKVKFLLTDPTQRQPPPTHPSDADDVEAKMRLLLAELGGEEIYTRDNTTGEITCPNDFIDWYDHLRVAHGIDTAAMEAITDLNERIATLHSVHGQGHSPKYPAVGKGGFAHRHVPEEHNII